MTLPNLAGNRVSSKRCFPRFKQPTNDGEMKKVGTARRQACGNTPRAPTGFSIACLCKRFKFVRQDAAVTRVKERAGFPTSTHAGSGAIPGIVAPNNVAVEHPDGVPFANCLDQTYENIKNCFDLGGSFRCHECNFDEGGPTADGASARAFAPSPRGNSSRFA